MPTEPAPQITIDHKPRQTLAANAPGKGLRLILQRIGATTIGAIHPFSHRTAWFWLDETTLLDATAWAEKYNREGFNVYFTLNEPTRGLKKKPAKSEITMLRGCGADIDAKDGRTMAEALAEIDNVRVQPSLTIMTGGGYQPLWMLSEPISATKTNVHRIEVLGEQIAQLVGGDAVQNADRILRLPFSLNYPNAKKIAGGRTTCVSGVVVVL